MPAEQVVEVTEELVRDALAHLYDNAYLRGHPLLPLLVRRHMPDPLARTQHMREVIIEAIHRLRPAQPIAAGSKEWRPYGILAYRYLDGKTDEQIQRELGISERQFFRDLKAGMALLTANLQPLCESKQESVSDALDNSLDGMGLKYERLDLNRLGQEVLPLVQGLANSREIKLALQPAAAPAVAIADAALSRQALISLLSLALRLAADIVQLSVVSCPQTQAIFLDYRGEDTTARQQEETLALAQRLLEQQGGFLQNRADENGKQHLGLHWRRFEEPPILLVDDNEGMLRLFSRYLSGHSYRIIGTSDGSAAVRLASENRVRLIVLDVMMRDMDGWAVLQQLKSEPLTQDIPVLICSVINEPELALTLGAIALLKKPASREQLLDTVAAIIGI